MVRVLDGEPKQFGLPISPQRARNLVGALDRLGLFPGDRALRRALLARARLLADDEREDEEAVRDLVVLAGADVDALQAAAVLASFHRPHHDAPAMNVARWLLEAAASRAEPQTEAAEPLGIFDVLPLDEKWARLSARNPELSELEADARAGRFGDGTRMHRSEHMATEDSAPAAEAEKRVRLYARLTQILGPASSAHDDISGSRTALRAASEYLAERSNEYWSRNRP